MGQVAINGALLGGPTVIGGPGFPGAIFNAPLALSTNPKAYSAASGVLTRRVATLPLAWTVLTGVGSDDSVQRGDTLYIRSDAPLMLRLSRVDPLAPLGPPIEFEVYIQGLYVMEFAPGSPLVKLEAQGAATIEYLITGQ